MWHHIAAFILKYRIFLLVLLLAATGVMGVVASRVQLSYEFTNAIPTDNPEYTTYQAFRKQFGEDGNMMVVGLQTSRFFEQHFFQDYTALAHRLAQLPAVENVLSVPTAFNLVKDTASNKLRAVSLTSVQSPPHADSVRTLFYHLPFYNGFLYNPQTQTFLMALRIDKGVLNSSGRTQVVNRITGICDSFGQTHQTALHYSGLPFIRTVMAEQVQKEMRFFLLLSFVLTAVILASFFRSFFAVAASMLVVAAGVVWSLGTLVLMGYKITLLSALIPPLVVVIGIPNCVYLLNKYHSEYSRHGNKMRALLRMVDRMGIVTLFTNLTAAIGFGVFFFTRSAILKEFGLVAGINIMILFVISLIFIPAVFSLLPPPRRHHTSYLESPWMDRVLHALTTSVFHYRPLIYVTTILVVVASLAGILRLNSVGHVVDDLPKDDVVYRDLKFFERNFHGVMPLEIVVDTRRKNGAVSLPVLQKMDQFSQYLRQFPDIGHPLSITEGLKFARQAYYNGDSSSYGLPNMFDGAFIQPYLRNHGDKSSVVSKLLTSFVDSSRQKARISVNMADVGSKRLPIMLDSIQKEAYRIFDSSRYTISFTGTSVVFLEGSKFIIHSLRDSLILAFIMIFGCMIFLFRSWRILLISIVVNMVPLVITAGVMGWAGIPIKPSTVLVFSVALGITVDVTIRFLVNFKQELSTNEENIAVTVRKTIRETGLSIIYTSLILIAGFFVFALSDFDGTKSLGYLTSLTLLLAMITNLTLQPALLLWVDKARQRKIDTKWLTQDEPDDSEVEL